MEGVRREERLRAQQKIFLGFFAATALLALAILGLLTGLDRFQRVPVG